MARAADAQNDLGFCYWREGAFNEAWILLDEAQKKLSNDDDQELLAKILIRRVLVESCSGRYNDSLRLLTEATQLFEESTSAALKGKFHNELGCVLMFLRTAEHRQDYIDRAIIEYTAASHYFQQAGHMSYQARAENNLGYLLYTVRQYDEAHEDLDQARRMFMSLRDKGSVAQVDDTRARLFLAQNQPQLALQIIRNAVRNLEKGREQAQLAEALTTLGLIQARVADIYSSQSTLHRAITVAERAGAMEDGARAALTLIEEHAERLSAGELFKLYDRADDLLLKLRSER